MTALTVIDRTPRFGRVTVVDLVSGSARVILANGQQPTRTIKIDPLRGPRGPAGADGDPGPAGADGADGIARAWDGATTYAADVTVTQDGILYYSLVANNTNNDPAATLGTAWGIAIAEPRPIGSAGTIGQAGYALGSISYDSAGRVTGGSGVQIGVAGGLASYDDARLSDARTPTGAAGGDLAGTYPDPTLAAHGAGAGTTTADVGKAIRSITVDSKGRVDSIGTPTSIDADIVLVWRPGGTTGGNVYATEAELYTAFQACPAGSYVTIRVDSSGRTAGEWASLSNTLWITETHDWEDRVFFRFAVPGVFYIKNVAGVQWKGVASVSSDDMFIGTSFYLDTTLAPFFVSSPVTTAREGFEGVLLRSFFCTFTQNSANYGFVEVANGASGYFDFNDTTIAAYGGVLGYIKNTGTAFTEVHFSGGSTAFLPGPRGALWLKGTGTVYVHNGIDFISWPGVDISGSGFTGTLRVTSLGRGGTTWLASTYYRIGDVVTVSGVAYVAIAANTNQAPASSPSRWSLLQAALYPGLFTCTGTTTAAFTAIAAVTSVTYSQADKTTNGGTGASTTIRAQNETGTTSTGGDLVLASGTGTTAPGKLDLAFGATTLVRLNGTTAQPQVQLGDSALGSAVSGSLFGNPRALAHASGSVCAMGFRGPNSAYVSIGVGATTTYTEKMGIGYRNGGPALINTISNAFQIETNATANAVPIRCEGASSNLTLCGVGSTGVFVTVGYGGGQGVAAIANATTAPTTNPTGGALLYSSGGVLQSRSSAGVALPWGTPSASVIVDSMVSATAAIAGTKISPAFGAQDVSANGRVTFGASHANASSTNASILGGRENTIDTASEAACVIGSLGGTARMNAQVVHAGGYTTTKGERQSSEVIIRCDTTGAQTGSLLGGVLAGAPTQPLLTQAARTYTVEILVNVHKTVAVEADIEVCAGWKITAVVYNRAGTVYVKSGYKVELLQDLPLPIGLAGATVTLSGSGNNLVVTGDIGSGNTISTKWAARANWIENG